MGPLLQPVSKILAGWWNLEG